MITCEEFTASLKAEFHKYFPNGFIQVSGDDDYISIRFGMIASEDQTHTTLRNDPMFHLFTIHDSCMEGVIFRDQITVELVLGNSLRTKIRVDHPQVDRVRLGYRTITAKPEKAVERFGKYFAKCRDTVKEQALLKNIYGQDTMHPIHLTFKGATQ